MRLPCIEEIFALQNQRSISARLVFVFEIQIGVIKTVAEIGIMNAGIAAQADLEIAMIAQRKEARQAAGSGVTR